MKAELQEQRTSINRTGIMTHPDLSAELIRGAKQTPPNPKADPGEIVSLRAAYIEEKLPIGSKPRLLGLQDNEIDAGAAEYGGIVLLLDKLGERLAFERQGARLYEMLLQKRELADESNGDGPSAGDLRHIHDEELEHFRLLQKVIREMGGDATVETPSADVAGVLSLGILQVVSDPRTTLAQSLQAMLNAELADNDGWQMLIDLSSNLGRADLETPFKKALEAEQEHLENVRVWLEEMTLKEARVLPDDGEIAEAEVGSRGGSRKRSGGARSARSKKRKKR